MGRRADVGFGRWSGRGTRTATSSAVDLETDGASCDGKCVIVGREQDVVVLLAHQQSARKVQRAQRSDQRGKRLGGTFHDRAREWDQVDALNRFQHGRPLARNGFVGQLELNTRPIDRSEAFESKQMARQCQVDPFP